MDDTPNRALEGVVKALGGSKAVAPLIWPEKGIEEARRLLCDCLNDDRPAKLDFAQVLFILRLARQRGIHAGMHYVCEALSYAEPVPVEPSDQADELRRQFIEATRLLAKLAERIEQVERPSSVMAMVGAMRA